MPGWPDGRMADWLTIIGSMRHYNGWPIKFCNTRSYKKSYSKIKAQKKTKVLFSSWEEWKEARVRVSINTCRKHVSYLSGQTTVVTTSTKWMSLSILTAWTEIEKNSPFKSIMRVFRIFLWKPEMHSTFAVIHTKKLLI